MAKNSLINGDSKNSLSPFDRGLAFGDGVFRTFLVEGSKPKLWKIQYQKLSQDLKAIEVKPPSQKIILSDIKKLFPSKGIFIAKRNIDSFSETVRHVINNYQDIQEDIKKNKFTTKKDMVKQISDIVG